MSRNYDNWEKLVGAILRREKDRQLSYCESFSTTYSSDHSSRFSIDSVAEDADFTYNPITEEAQAPAVMILCWVLILDLIALFIRLFVTVNTKASSTTISSHCRAAHVDRRPKESEWIELVEPGVYIFLSSLPGGFNNIKRIRFRRPRFNENQAEQWWAENQSNEMLEQVEPGVYITLTSLPGELKDLTRVRLSRKRFSAKQAEEWWAENRARVYKQYNVWKVDKPSDGVAIEM